MTPLHLFDIPRPRTFLRAMSLRTGAEIIAFLQLINKVSGLYGILALLTGAPLSPLQFTMYLYSLFALVATTYLYPHIRLGSPLRCLALAHLYAIDSVINAMYTAAFGVAWFYVLAANPNEEMTVPGAPGINQTAGFTNPKYNVSSVEVLAEPAGGLKPGQDAIAVGKPGSLSSAVFQSGSFMSIALICLFWTLRTYFVFVMLAFARQTLRHHIATTSTAGWNTGEDSTNNMAENPFAEGREEGAGWQGKLGRVMLGFAPRYWLGADEDGEWMRGLGGKFRKSLQEPVGVMERERRRRSGTGPPAAPRELIGLNSLPEAR